MGSGEEGRGEHCLEGKRQLKMFPVLKDKHGDVKDICSTFSFSAWGVGGGGRGELRGREGERDS